MGSYSCSFILVAETLGMSAFGGLRCCCKKFMMSLFAMARYVGSH